jgi:hypothetical protein
MTKPKADRSVDRNMRNHRCFSLLAAIEAERVLPLFQKERPDDDRPRLALEAIKAWANGERELGMAEVRKLYLDSHAAARESVSAAVRFAARVAGHAVATWHVPTHVMGASIYARKAFVANIQEESDESR